MTVYLSRTKRRMICNPGEMRRWNNLPYGRWICADGREVLFNRFYEPILQKQLNGICLIEADAHEWVPFVQQEWFYDDGHVEKEKRTLARRALRSRGFSVEEIKAIERPLVKESRPRGEGWLR